MSSTFFEMLRDSFSGFGSELLENVRQSVAAEANEAAQNAASYQWELGVEKAVAAMLDLKISDDKIIAMLQKHWDFRLSEATDYLRKYKDWKAKRKK